jgi:hypothetical protein
MPTHVEAYTMGGIATGVVTRPEHLREILENEAELVLGDASEAPLDGSPIQSGEQRLPVDDVVIVVGDEEQPGPVHAVWHPIRLEAGPWLVQGDLPTLPGFDPGRALTRPSGTFVLLRDVRVSLLANPDAGENAHAQALVNRYSVDRVDATLMLGFFFPGAHIDAPAPAAPPSTGVPAAPADPSTALADPSTAPAAAAEFPA